MLYAVVRSVIDNGPWWHFTFIFRADKGAFGSVCAYAHVCVYICMNACVHACMHACMQSLRVSNGQWTSDALYVDHFSF